MTATSSSSSNSWCLKQITYFCNLSTKKKFAILGVWLILIELGIFPHIKRGFHCDDKSIAYKFTGDTISTSLVLATVLVPFFMMWLSEAIFYKPTSIKESRLRKSLHQSYFWYREFFVGMILHIFVVDALKVIVGELRPHFLDTCQPDAAVNCFGPVFITDYTCTNTVQKSFFVRDASKSFPSGHSSITFFEAVFMIWYIQRRVPNMRSKMLMPTIQVMCLMWAFYCSLSRITDHRHHWWDVVCGAILGILFSILTCIFLCKDFKMKSEHSTSVQQNGNNGDRHHTSVRRLLSDVCAKDEVTMTHVVV